MLQGPFRVVCRLFNVQINCHRECLDPLKQVVPTPVQSSLSRSLLWGQCGNTKGDVDATENAWIHSSRLPPTPV